MQRTGASECWATKLEAPMVPEVNLSFDLEFNLALAVIDASTAPLLLLDGELRLIAASKSFCRVFQIEPANVPGRALRELGSGEWNVPATRVSAQSDGLGLCRNREL